MIQYRVLECLNDSGEWKPDGVAYIEGGECLFYRYKQTLVQKVESLTQLGETEYPRGQGIMFRWRNNIQEWDDEQIPFDPEAILQNIKQTKQTQQLEEQLKEQPSWRSVDDLPPKSKRALVEMLSDISALEKYPKVLLELIENFIFLFENGFPPYKELVYVILRHWSLIDKKEDQEVLLPKDEHKVRLLLYAQVFELPLPLSPEQKDCLTRNKDLYTPLTPTPQAWGARTALSKNVLVMLNSPVMYVWVFKQNDEPERIVIVGKGLTEHREKVFNEALVTALRVQGHFSDVLNDGLIIITRNVEVANALELNLPILGANAPLADAETTVEAMRALIRQLKLLAKDTGFVQVYEVGVEDTNKLNDCFRELAKTVKNLQEPILWMPDSEAMASGKELVTSQPILNISPGNRRLIPLQLTLSPELLRSNSWKELIAAYEKEVISRIALDAKIRLDFYQKRENSLRNEIEQWDKASKQDRQERWGATVTLTERFDENTGVIIWLRPPEIISTEEYFRKNVPYLIHHCTIWSKRMANILESLAKASQRPDAPFNRLATNRFFDAALRRGLGLELEDMPKVKKLYEKWATPIINLLQFEWRKQLHSMGVDLQDLFTVHTTFSLFQGIDEQGNITQLLMIPHTLIDAKRSVVLFDPKCQIMIAKDASDYPQEITAPSSVIDLQQKLEKYQDSSNVAEFCESLREMLIDNPTETIRQVLERLRPKVTKDDLSKDTEQLQESKEQVLSIPLSVPRLLERAENAMWNSALFTANSSLEDVLTAIPKLNEKWNKLKNSEQLQHLEIIPEKELRCRIHLLIALAGCLTKWSCDPAPEQTLKDYLLLVFRTPHRAGELEKTALIKARKANSKYVQNWIEYLSKWEPDLAAKKLTRDLPIEEELTSLRQYGAMRIFDAIEIIHIANQLREAAHNLNHVQETRATALMKLGPALEQAILSSGGNIVYGDLVSLLEILTGTTA